MSARNKYWVDMQRWRVIWESRILHDIVQEDRIAGVMEHSTLVAEGIPIMFMSKKADKGLVQSYTYTLPGGQERRIEFTNFHRNTKSFDRIVYMDILRSVGYYDDYGMPRESGIDIDPYLRPIDNSTFPAEAKAAFRNILSTRQCTKDVITVCTMLIRFKDDIMQHGNTVCGILKGLNAWDAGAIHRYLKETVTPECDWLIEAEKVISSQRAFMLFCNCIRLCPANVFEDQVVVAEPEDSISVKAWKRLGQMQRKASRNVFTQNSKPSDDNNKPPERPHDPKPAPVEKKPVPAKPAKQQQKQPAQKKKTPIGDPKNNAMAQAFEQLNI